MENMVMTKEEARYQAFLEDVKQNTIKTVGDAKQVPDGGVIPYEVVGIEFLSWRVEEKYGEDIYRRACEEVPYEKVPNDNGGYYRIFKRDFSKASRRLGHVIQESVSATPLVDLDLLVTLLAQKGIPSYFDFETNMFYYNGSLENQKEEKAK